MKTKKEHGSDDEQEDVTQEEIVQDHQRVTPVSPPSQDVAQTRPRANEVEQFRYTYMEDPEEGVLFEEQSMEIKCPYCETKALSIVEYKNNILGYLISLILLFALGWLSFCILPLVLSLTKNAVHRCSKCLNEVKNNSYLGFNSMEDKVISFNIGSFGIILSRKYLLYIFLSITCVIVLFLLLSAGVNMNEENTISDISWADYRDDCGFMSFTKEPRKTIRKFDRQYAGRGVNWDGYIVQVNALSEDSLAHFHHASSLLVKMVPDDKSEDDASLALTLSERMTEKYKEELLQLNVGDHINFNATIVGLGDRNHLHHLHTFGLEKVEGTAHVNLHVHYNGRYKIRKEGDTPSIV